MNRKKMSRKRKIARFDKKYAKKGGFKKLKQMIDNLATLEEIGKTFGFSRQNTAGLFYSFFGKHYKSIQKKRSANRRNQKLEELLDLDNRLAKLKKDGKMRSYKKTFYLKKVKEEAEKNGLNVELVATKAYSPRLIINGYQVNICGTEARTIYHFPRKGNPTVYYRFAVSSRPHDFSIFVLEEPEEKFTYYIIPYKMIKALNLVTLRTTYENPRNKGRNGSKYLQYRNAWNLLSEPVNE